MGLPWLAQHLLQEAPPVSWVTCPRPTLTAPEGTCLCGLAVLGLDMREPEGYPSGARGTGSQRYDNPTALCLSKGKPPRAPGRQGRGEQEETGVPSVGLRGISLGLCLQKWQDSGVNGSRAGAAVEGAAPAKEPIFEQTAILGACGPARACGFSMKQWPGPPTLRPPCCGPVLVE